MLSNVILAESITHRARFAWLAAALAATVAIATLSFGAEPAEARGPRIELRSPMCGEARHGRHHHHARDAERDRERLERKVERAKERAARAVERAERRAAREAMRAEREAAQAAREAAQAAREAAQIQREAEQALREAGQEARAAARATNVYIFR